jgi:hypothetical protein
VLLLHVVQGRVLVGIVERIEPWDVEPDGAGFPPDKRVVAVGIPFNVAAEMADLAQRPAEAVLERLDRLALAGMVQPEEERIVGVQGRNGIVEGAETCTAPRRRRLPIPGGGYGILVACAWPAVASRESVEAVRVTLGIVRCAPTRSPKV